MSAGVVALQCRFPDHIHRGVAALILGSDFANPFGHHRPVYTCSKVLCPRNDENCSARSPRRPLRFRLSPRGWVYAGFYLTACAPLCVAATVCRCC